MIEDETGIANFNLWPDRFEIYRRPVMSASMFAMRGRLQKEGEVIHNICGRLDDHDAMLRSIRRMDFTVTPVRGWGEERRRPDPRSPAWTPRGRTFASAPSGTTEEQQGILRICSHDFH